MTNIPKTPSVQISAKARKNLRIALAKSYVTEFEADLTDSEVDGLGSFFIVVLGEYLKMEIKTHNDQLIR